MPVRGGRAIMQLLRAQIVSRKKLHREDSRKNPPNGFPVKVDENDTDSPKVEKRARKGGLFSHACCLQPDKQVIAVAPTEDDRSDPEEGDPR
jgi:hypothetical protein